MTNNVSANPFSTWIIERYSENLEEFHKIAECARDIFQNETEDTEENKLYEVISGASDHVKQGIDFVNAFAIALIDNNLEGDFYAMASKIEPLLRNLEEPSKAPSSAIGVDDLFTCLPPEIKVHLFEVFKTEDEVKILEQEENLLYELQELSKSNEEVRDILENAGLMPPLASQSESHVEDALFTPKEREQELEINRLKRRVEELEKLNLELSAALSSSMKKQKVEEGSGEELIDVSKDSEEKKD